MRRLEKSAALLNIELMDATSLLDRRPLHALLAALKPISDRDSHIRVAWIKTLLLVALDEGKGVAHYSRAAKVRRTIMSRYLHCIGDKKRRDDNIRDLGWSRSKLILFARIVGKFF